MRCNTTKDYLERYKDGTLSSALRLKIETHLRECAGCQSAYAEMAQFKLLLSTLPLPSIPADTAEAIVATVAQSIAARKKQRAFQWLTMGEPGSTRATYREILSTFFIHNRGGTMKKPGALKWYGLGFATLAVALVGVFSVVSKTSSSRIVLANEIEENRTLLHNASGDHKCDCFSPFISDFVISNITATGATITWDCSSPSSYQVKYGTTATKGTKFPAVTPTVPYTKHSDTLTGLTPNTTYHVGPSSICLSNCTNNEVGGLRKEFVQTGDKQSDWIFKTLTSTATLVEAADTRWAVSEAVVAKISAKDVTITWKTNVPATSMIEYGLSTNYGMKSGVNTEMVKNHDIQLFGLQPATTYYCRAVSNPENAVSPVYSETMTFKTPAFEDRIAEKTRIYNEPNPCSDWTIFSYFLYQPAKSVTIDILTLSGKHVASLQSPSTSLADGWNKVRWDNLRDSRGKPLSNGIYMYKMKFQTPSNNVQEVLSSSLRVAR